MAEIKGRKLCRACLLLEKCTQNRISQNPIPLHIREKSKEQDRMNRLSNEGKWLYRIRKEKMERSLADSKELHGL
ncbi:transposase [Cerasibacillus sp. JNUCC 74]